MLFCILKVLVNIQKLPTYFRTATSFLKACSCAGVGSVKLSFFTATGPAKYNHNHVLFLHHCTCT